MNTKAIVLLVFLILGSIFVYAERILIPPLVVAAIFAYILNPVINTLHRTLRVPRPLSIILIYFILIGLLILAGDIIAQQVGRESTAINRILNQAANDLDSQVSHLPDVIQPSVQNLGVTLRRAGLLGFFFPPSANPSLSGVFTRLTTFFIFLFSGYYFLQDGEAMIHRLVLGLSEKWQKKTRQLLHDINGVLGSYLRGQLFLIFFVSLVLYVALAILGVRFALTIAIFSGFAEIVPLAGPIIATIVAVAVVFLTGGVGNFPLAPFNAGLIVILIYFLVRQFEDYVVLPHVMGRITKLPSFVIFLAVLAGGHIWGVLGLILAVPLTAVGRLVYLFIYENFYKVS